MIHDGGQVELIQPSARSAPAIIVAAPGQRPPSRDLAERRAKRDSAGIGPVTGDPSHVVWWLVSRSSGIIALVLISASVLLGLAMAAKLVAPRTKDPPAAARVPGDDSAGGDRDPRLGAARRHLAEAGHAGISVPFEMAYRPAFTGLGIMAGYLALLMGPSFYLRRRIGARRWRKLHRWPRSSGSSRRCTRSAPEPTARRSGCARSCWHRRSDRLRPGDAGARRRPEAGDGDWERRCGAGNGRARARTPGRERGTGGRERVRPGATAERPGASACPPGATAGRPGASVAAPDASILRTNGPRGSTCPSSGPPGARARPDDGSASVGCRTCRFCLICRRICRFGRRKRTVGCRFATDWRQHGYGGLGMNTRSVLTTTAAILGMVFGLGVIVRASQLAGQQIGLGSQPVTIVSALAPRVVITARSAPGTARHESNPIQSASGRPDICHDHAGVRQHGYDGAGSRSRGRADRGRIGRHPAAAGRHPTAIRWQPPAVARRQIRLRRRAVRFRRRAVRFRRRPVGFRRRPVGFRRHPVGSGGTQQVPAAPSQVPAAPRPGRAAVSRGRPPSNLRRAPRTACSGGAHPGADGRPDPTPSQGRGGPSHDPGRTRLSGGDRGQGSGTRLGDGSGAAGGSGSGTTPGGTTPAAPAARAAGPRPAAPAARAAGPPRAMAPAAIAATAAGSPRAIDPAVPAARAAGTPVNPAAVTPAAGTAAAREPAAVGPESVRNTPECGHRLQGRALESGAGARRASPPPVTCDRSVRDRRLTITSG